MSDDRRPARPSNRRPGGPGGRPGQRHAPRGFRGGERFGPETVWLFGLHAVRDALLNPERDRRRLILTRNAAMRLGDEAILAGGIEPEIVDPRKFTAPIDPQSVHQGAALEAAPLDWGRIEDLCAPDPDAETRDIVVLMDRVTDPHNVGAVLRSSEVFGARAVIAPARHAAPETGALAKTASGALERQPYCRVKNLGTAMETLRDMGYAILGLDGEGEMTIAEALAEVPGGRARPVALALGAEGPGLRDKTRGLCDALVRIDSAADFASLNVSNAAAVALYATRNG
ncbi:TrmH family RNA methyltransferase [Rhodovulum sp. DZ06]|uniref:TrmH family RNA methyltransferase n=1 Tax=Rhodovulum sp. DZ06 TaxID=3425126 RepID=UPI003D3400B0